MGTKLIIGTTLLLAVGLASSSNTAASPSAAVATGSAKTVPKTKRGIVAVGGNIWTNEGVAQANANNPGLTRSLIVQQNSGVPVQNPSSNPGFSYVSASSPAQANLHTRQNTRTNPQVQNYGSVPRSQNFGYNGFPIQSSNVPVSSPAQQYQNPQNGQLQNIPISTPYFGAFLDSSSALKVAADKQQPSARNENTYAGLQAVHKLQEGGVYAPSHMSSFFQEKPSADSSNGNPIVLPIQQSVTFGQNPSFLNLNIPNLPASSNIYQNAQIPEGTTGDSQQNNAAFKQSYAPQYQTSLYPSPAAQTHGNILQNNPFNVPTVEFNGGSIPLPALQLQSAEAFPAFHKAIENQPLILDSGISFQGQPSLGLISFEKSPAPQSQSPLTLYSAQGNSQHSQVLPVQSANGTPQLPKYKGARLETFPKYNIGLTPNSYQPLKAQPQLHFSKKPVQPVEQPRPVTTSFATAHVKPLEGIRDDVEVIKKNKPPPRDTDDDELDEGYKAIEREYGNVNDGDHEEPRQSYRESDEESDVKSHKSSPFKYYDEKFKYSAPFSKDEAEDDNQGSKYRQYSSADDSADEDNDGYSTRQHSDYELPESSFSDDAEDERSNKQKDEADGRDDHAGSTKQYSNYGNDFEREFEESYRRELPKNNYVHKKEVPEIDEPSYKKHSTSASSSSPASDGSESNNKYRYSQPSKAPKVIHEESFGYREPHRQSYSSSKKSPADGSYEHASRSSFKKKSPENPDKSAYEDGQSYSYSSGNSWKSDKKSPEKSSSYGQASSVVHTLAKPNSKSNFRAPGVNRGTSYYSENVKIVRDLTGI